MKGISAFLLGASLLVITCGDALGSDKDEKADARLWPAPKREDLRYDGKSFEEWAKYVRIELKPERRAAAMEALGTFGTAGYAKEATEVILGILWECRKKSPDNAEDYISTNQAYTVVEACFAALKQMGSAATPTLLANVSHPTTRAVVWSMDRHYHIAISEKDIPTLAKLAVHKNRDIQSVAIRLLKRVSPKALESSLPKSLDSKKLKDQFVYNVAVDLRKAGYSEAFDDAVAFRLRIVQSVGVTKPDDLLKVLLKVWKTEKLKGAPKNLWEYNRGAIRLIARIKGPAKVMVPVLMEILQEYGVVGLEYRCLVFESLVAALGSYGPKAKKALPVLRILKQKGQSLQRKSKSSYPRQQWHRLVDHIDSVVQRIEGMPSQFDSSADGHTKK